MSTPAVTRILITGQHGFIGKYLVEHLKRSAAPFEPIFFSGDLLNYQELERFFKEQKKIGTIVHLAGTFEGDFHALIEKNVMTTQNLLQISKTFLVSSFIHASSGAVYDESALNRTAKEEDPRKPSTLYGLSKKMAEDLVFYFHRMHKLRFLILRFPNVYGASNTKGVLYHFLQDIRTQGKITIHGDGTQSRQFLHVSDACEAIEKSLHYKDCGVFNISNPKSFSIREIVDILKQKTPFEVQYAPTSNSLQHLLLDTSQAENRLGFRARVTDLNFSL